MTATYSEDLHSFARPEEAVVTHLHLNIRVDFARKMLSGKATLDIEVKENVRQLLLDTQGLIIEKVTLDEDQPTSFHLGKTVEHLGQPFEITIHPETQKVTIVYQTSPTAEALQWLNPQQTAGKKHPFLFTQSQAILARSWVPCQDSPGIRFTYSARVQVPNELLAVMSASNPTQKNDSGLYTFEMKLRIPAYLLALAVGDITFRALDERTGVYAEPVTLEKAVNEFAETGRMLETAEQLYGPYAWERYDLLVLPPSFPFGGMENPRLTFTTPTILAGDRSLTSLIAHELAHSWSGNLVTNRTWNDFWLNEGFTVYFERRIMESLYGRSYSEMLALLGYQDLQETVNELGTDSADTKLKLNLEGRSPDEGVSDIAYEKGYFLLRLIEETIGREKCDAFVTAYFREFAFRSMGTEQFLLYIERKLFENNPYLERKINIRKWLYDPGIPANCPQINSERLKNVDNSVDNWINTHVAANLSTQGWTSHEWLHFIRHLPFSMTIAQMEDLDQAFHFTDSGNAEVLAAWFLPVIRNQYEQAYPALKKFLLTVGRRKFLTPLYKALIQTEDGAKRALQYYSEARPNYHYVTTNPLDSLFAGLST